jgi:hypothetical protein
MSRPLSPRVAAYARQAVLSYHNIEIEVVRQLISSLNDETGMITTTFDENYVGYVGTGRFWLSNDSSLSIVGDGDYSTIATNISIPWDATPVPDLDEYVVVTSSYEDPTLEGKIYRIVGVDGGGFLRAARRLSVVAVSENRDTRG